MSLTKRIELLEQRRRSQVAARDFVSPFFIFTPGDMDSPVSFALGGPGEPLQGQAGREHAMGDHELREPDEDAGIFTTNDEGRLI